MPLICVSSPKGGVGKTTLTANLCYALARSGVKTIALDFDPQNALRIHFGIPLTETNGYVEKTTEQEDWCQSLIDVGGNMFVLPYGECDDDARMTFDLKLTHDENFLMRGLSSLLNYPGIIVIADFQTGPSPAQMAVSEIADLHLIPLNADTASLSLLPKIEDLTFHARNGEEKHPFFILNQVDTRRQISRTVAEYLTERFDKRLLGTIHRDESVVEAHSAQKSIFSFNPSSAAAFDIEVVSKKITNLLGIQIGDGTVHAMPQAVTF